MEARTAASGALAVLALCFFLMGVLQGRAQAQPADGGPPPSAEVEVTPGSAEGQPIAEVRVDLRDPLGKAVVDEALRQQVATALGLTAGQLFRPLLAETGLGRVRALPRVSSAEFELFQAERIGDVVAVARATVLPEGVERARILTGFLNSGDIKDLPDLHKSDRALLKMILNGGVGAFGASQPFFGRSDVFLAGSPIAQDPPKRGAAWAEWYLEPGVGGITQVGSAPLYVYGAVTYLAAQSLGQDVYNSYTRNRGDVEKAYVGFLYDLPGKGNVVDVSGGRQIYQLREGFLISKVPGSTNIGRLGGLLLGPRLAFEKTLIARASLGPLKAEGIFLEPTEYDEIPNSNTQVAGGTLQYAFDSKVELGVTYLHVLSSDGAYLVGVENGQRVTRSQEGVRTYNGSLWARSLFGYEGLWFKSEYAYQDNEDYSMAAQAGYGWVGYEAKRLPWRPGLSYRYSLFTGDDPDTSKLERFDPLFSGGQQNFVPGMVMNAVTKNANLVTHRGRASVKPTDSLEIVLDYFRFRADERNNYGAVSPSMWSLQSKALADEFDLSAFWSASKSVYVQGLAAVAIPDDGIEAALGGHTHPWYNLQAALYFFF